MKASQCKDQSMDNINKRKQISGLIYGLFAGLALSIAIWGIDAFLLWQANAAFAWIRLLIGGFVTILVFSLAGWLAMRYEKNALSALLWLMASFVPANLLVIMTTHGWNIILNVVEPQIASRFTPPSYDYTTLTGILVFIFGLGAVIMGSLEATLVRQTFFSSAVGAMFGPVLLVAIVFAAFGLIADTTIHTYLRDPIINLNRTIQFAVENDLEQIDKTTARNMRTGALRSLGDIIYNPRRLMLASFNRITEETEIWVDFNGEWAYCVSVSGQVIHCEPAP